MEHRHLALMVVVSVSIYAMADAQQDLFQVQSKDSTSRHWCGRHLADVLQTVCHGKFNPMFRTKKNEDPDYAYQSDQQFLTSEQEMPSLEFAAVQPMLEYPYPFKARSGASSMTPRIFRRFTRGIVAECCDKPCSIQELQSYCGP